MTSFKQIGLIAAVSIGALLVLGYLNYEEPTPHEKDQMIVLNETDQTFDYTENHTIMFSEIDEDFE